MACCITRSAVLAFHGAYFLSFPAYIARVVQKSDTKFVEVLLDLHTLGVAQNSFCLILPC